MAFTNVYGDPEEKKYKTSEILQWIIPIATGVAGGWYPGVGRGVQTGMMMAEGMMGVKDWLSQRKWMAQSAEMAEDRLNPVRGYNQQRMAPENQSSREIVEEDMSSPQALPGGEMTGSLPSPHEGIDSGGEPEGFAPPPASRTLTVGETMGWKDPGGRRGFQEYAEFADEDPSMIAPRPEIDDLAVALAFSGGSNFTGQLGVDHQRALNQHSLGAGNMRLRQAELGAGLAGDQIRSAANRAVAKAHERAAMASAEAQKAQATTYFNKALVEAETSGKFAQVMKTFANAKEIASSNGASVDSVYNMALDSLDKDDLKDFWKMSEDFLADAISEGIEEDVVFWRNMVEVFRGEASERLADPSPGPSAPAPVSPTPLAGDDLEDSIFTSAIGG